MEQLQDDVINMEELLTKAGVEPGMKVGDLGVGRQGTLTIAAGRRVTSTGVVYAVDVVKEILRLISEKVENAGVHNVLTVWSDLEVYGGARQIIDGALDTGMLVNTIYQSQHRADMMKECSRMIHPGGTLLVVDWKKAQTPFGPPVEHRATAEEVKEIASSLGLQLVDSFEAGEYHWGVLFQKI